MGMTEKRWKIIDEEFISYTGGNAIIISNGDFKFAIWEIKEDVQKICNKLNKLVDENKKLQSINQDHRDYIMDVEADFKRLEQHNKELQERNNRQAKQLDKVYKLMEKQDYKTLQNIIQDFKEAEELLKQEWKCFDD